MLNELRIGSLSEGSIKTFTSLERPLSYSSALHPTELYPTRSEVDRSNQRRLNGLKTPLHEFIAQDSGKAPDTIRQPALNEMLAPEKLYLKVGAQVMLIRNEDEERGLVNGAIGRIRMFYHARKGKAAGVLQDVLVDKNGKQIYDLAPPVVAVADENINTTNDNTASRTKGVSPSLQKSVPTSPSSGFTDQAFPYVEFTTSKGTYSVLVTYGEFRSEDHEGNLIARRVQVGLPLHPTSKHKNTNYHRILSLLRCR
jgi:hypothetical protein